MSETKIDWPVIVQGVCAGDEFQIKEFVELAQKPLFRFCLYLAGNKQLAEDICHDALIKAITSMSQLKDHHQVMSWLKQIARRLFLDYCKSAARSKVHIDIQEFSDNSELSVNSGANDQQILAMQALQSLEEEERVLVILIDIEGYTYSEVAQTVKINEGTVKSKVFRARKKMLDYLGTKQGLKSS